MAEGLKLQIEQSHESQTFCTQLRSFFWWSFLGYILNNVKHIEAISLTCFKYMWYPMCVMARWREFALCRLCQDDSKGSEVLGALRIGSTSSISLEEDLLCSTEKPNESWKILHDL